MNLFQVTKKQPSGGLELKTATGDIASFTTHYSEPLPAPFNNLNVKCTIVASGGGTPSTPIPIVGYSSLNLTHCGVNVWNGQWEEGEISASDGQDRTSSSYWRTAGYIPIKPDTQYYMYSPNGTYPRARFYDANKGYIGTTDKDGNDLLFNRAFTTAVNAHYMRFAPLINISTTAGVNHPSSVTTYQPYNGTTDTIALGSTVYGGELDVTSGKVTITHDYVDLGNYYWSYNSNYGFICTGLSSVIKNASSYSTKANILCDKYETDTYDRITSGQTNYCIGVSAGGYGYVVISNSDYNTEYAFNQAIQGTMLAFEMKTPQTVQLTPTQVQAILGDNNVFADTGSVEVKYLDVV